MCWDKNCGRLKDLRDVRTAWLFLEILEVKSSSKQRANSSRVVFYLLDLICGFELQTEAWRWSRPNDRPLRQTCVLVPPECVISFRRGRVAQKKTWIIVITTCGSVKAHYKTVKQLTRGFLVKLTERTGLLQLLLSLQSSWRSRGQRPDQTKVFSKLFYSLFSLNMETRTKSPKTKKLWCRYSRS